MDCGPACLKMIASYYGKHFTLETLRKYSGYNKEGVSLLSLSSTAEKLGFRTRGVRVAFSDLPFLGTPCILHWDQNHFVVLLKVKKHQVKIADPRAGIINISKNVFIEHWAISSTLEDSPDRIFGNALLLETTPNFFSQEGEKESNLSWDIILQYLLPNKKKLFQVFLALILVSSLQLIFPFLTQSLVDSGINANNLEFVTLILIAQVFLTCSITLIEFIRTKTLLEISNILNIQILSDFWIKLTKLPISYFESHHTGDILQRLGDHKQIQSFLTGTALSTIFSIFNFLVYAVILIMYRWELFAILIVGNVISFGWIILFLRLRRKLNYQTFGLATKENNATLQLIQGMQDIRLNNADTQKRWQWEDIQIKNFKLNLKSLNYSQVQSAGATLISQIQGLLISYFVARLVIKGELTFGSMFAIQYIIGQLSGPLYQWITFIQVGQDAKISLERLNEIHKLQDEEDPKIHYVNELPESKTITFKNVSFAYTGSEQTPVLKEINLTIPENKITAIVGSSGSGKTSILKLLLKIYDPLEGEVLIGKNGDISDEAAKLRQVGHTLWRSRCGSVLQDGYLFNDTIINNIAVGDENADLKKIIKACVIANFHEFVGSLANGYNTVIGSDGIGMSQGQKQRLFIARAIYKNPDYLFLDEATNALDSNNEKLIVENLNKVFVGRTVVIVAHRLSTIKHADKIVVMEKGKIIQEGTHHELLSRCDTYMSLVKNQL